MESFTKTLLKSIKEKAKENFHTFEFLNLIFSSDSANSSLLGGSELLLFNKFFEDIEHLIIWS